MEELATQSGTPSEIFCGDALAVLASMPAAAYDCIITSPPYYKQRDYRGAAEQLGQEDSPGEYVARLVAIMGECRRVLKETGTLWLNIGDKYDDGRQLGMPWRVALAMIDDGWVLRSDIIWHKPNAMPSSVKNRPTVDHEYIFFFTKGGDYFYNADAIREPHVTFSEDSKMRGGRNHFGRRGGTPEQGKNAGESNLHDGRWDQAFHPLGRNKRTVWSIPLGKFRDVHFAVFPEQLVQDCILAGCPEGGIVLDPFCGSGTTLLVAQKLGRKWIGIDCVEEYCEMARARLAQATLF
jgi:site-specific DNA-methyltransferase (adenine-specific)